MPKTIPPALECSRSDLPHTWLWHQGGNRPFWSLALGHRIAHLFRSLIRLLHEQALALTFPSPAMHQSQSCCHKLTLHSIVNGETRNYRILRKTWTARVIQQVRQHLRRIWTGNVLGRDLKHCSCWEGNDQKVSLMAFLHLLPFWVVTRLISSLTWGMTNWINILSATFSASQIFQVSPTTALAGGTTAVLCFILQAHSFLLE